MLKSIFILEKLTKNKIDTVVSLRANAIFTGSHSLSKETFHYLKNKNLKLFAEFGLFQGEEWWRKYPNSRPLDKNGQKIPKIHWYAGVCPNNPHVRKSLLTSIKHLIEVYELDGLWLDFIRYPCHWEEVRNSKIKEYCFCPVCLDKFKKDTGAIPEGKKWIEWKCRQIADFVGEIKQIILKSRKDSSQPILTLGMFCIPWRETEYDGAIKRIIGQDFRLLPKYVDVFSPMVYHRFCDRPATWIGETVNYFSKVTKKPILPTIQTEDRAGKISQSEFKEELKQSFKPPSKGAIIFFLEDLLKNKIKTITVKDIFTLYNL